MLKRIRVFVAVATTLACCFAGSIAAQPANDREAAIQAARSYLQLSADEASARAENMSRQEIQNLITQILSVSEHRNPDLRNTYVLLEHLQKLEALAYMEARLDRLLFVLLFTVALMIGFLAYILFDQRKTIRRLERLTESADASASATAKADIYRGD